MIRSVAFGCLCVLVLLAGCDSDLYSDTSACRDLNASTPCDGEMLLNTAIEIDNSASARLPPSGSMLLHRCEPSNETARQVGNVAFTLDGANVAFIEPAVWRGPVETKRTDPPQDPPSNSLTWKSLDGQLLRGHITWPDDATPDPRGFGVQSGLKGQASGWATWRCNRAQA